MRLSNLKQERFALRTSPCNLRVKKYILNLMRKIVYILLIFLLISLSFNFYQCLPGKKSLINSRRGIQKTAMVIKVIDGDTFDIENGERLRLYEIDAPEYPKGCLGIEAKSRLEDLIFNKKIEIEQVKKDNNSHQ